MLYRLHIMLEDQFRESASLDMRLVARVMEREAGMASFRIGVRSSPAAWPDRSYGWRA